MAATCGGRQLALCMQSRVRVMIINKIATVPQTLASTNTPHAKYAIASVRDWMVLVAAESSNGKYRK